MEIKGFDGSHYQGDIDFPKAKADGYSFVLLKATEGTTYLDPKFDPDFSEAQSAGFDVGAYHFGNFSTVEQAKAEVDFFISHLKGKNLTYPAVLDMEQNKSAVSPQQLTDACIAFLEELESAGYFAMIYSGKYFFENSLQPERLAPYANWLAAYGVSVLGRSAGIWQFSDSGHINGISGEVDIDVSYEDFASEIAAMHPQAVPVVSPPEPIKVAPAQPVVTPPVAAAPIIVPETYTVQSGDVLSFIADKFSVAQSDIIKWNNISNPNLIQPGQILKLKAPVPVAPSVPDTYTVKSGDTLSAIAGKYGLTTTAIQGLNGIPNPNNIYAGQVLKLKKVVAPTLTNNGIPVVGTIQITNVANAAIICDKPSSTNSINLGLAPNGSKWPISGSVPGFYEIIYNGRRAYVNEKYAERV